MAIKRKNLLKPTTLFMTIRQIEMLQKESERLGFNRSELIRRILDEWLEKH